MIWKDKDQISDTKVKSIHIQSRERLETLHSAESKRPRRRRGSQIAVAISNANIGIFSDVLTDGVRGKNVIKKCAWNENWQK